MFCFSLSFQIQETPMTSSVSSLENATIVRAWTFFFPEMNSNALKAASKMPAVLGSVSILIQICVNCFQVVEALKTLYAQIA
jgi:hypothetical protein